jgi:type I restriction enzyme, S subunit
VSYLENQNTLPKDWTLVKLGEVCETTSGGTPSRRNLKYYEGNIPWVKSGELDKGLITETEEKISKEAIKNSSAKVFPKGTLLIALYGATIGKLAFLGVDAATNQAVCGIFRNDKIDSDFLYNYLFYKKPSLVKQGIGGAQPNISQGILKNLELPLPPKETQHAIVSKIEELFSELDKGKENLLTAQQQLKTYRQSVLKWAFEGKLTNENIQAGKLPKGWKWIELGEVCHNVEYGSGIKSKAQGKVPVLRMGNIQNGRFDWNDLVYSDDDVEIKKYLLKKNDVLFNRTNSAELVGKTAIYKNERPAIFAGYLIRINRIESQLNGDYLNYFLNSHFAKSYGNSIRSFGVNQSNINGTKLKTYPIPLPLIEEQHFIVQAIESRISVADKMEENIIQSLQRAEALKQSILKKAFEGKLV